MAPLQFVSIVLDAIFPPRAGEKMVNELTVPILSEHIAPTFFETKQGEHLRFLLPYQEHAVKALIIEAKYHGNQKAWNMLGQILSDFLVEHIEEETALTSSPFILIPIPLSSSRRKTRGHNQSEEIAKAALRIAPHFSLVPDLLIRSRDTVPQTTLNGAERRTNLQGAFRAGPLDPSAAYIVIDDVVTTGATLLEAMQALRQAGATKVSGLALAH